MQKSPTFSRLLRALLYSLVATLGFQSNLSASEPSWIFNNGPDAERAKVDQGRVNAEFGLFNIVPTGTDVKLHVEMKDEETFNSAEYPYFALRYKATTSQRIGGLFFTNDGALQSLSDDSYTPFAIEGDGEWRDVVVDMREAKHKNWEGRILSFRLDPTNPSDTQSKLSISRMGFFKSESAAYDFLADANDQPNLNLETTLSNEICRATLSAGAAKPGFDRTDFLLDPEDTLAASDQAVQRSALVVASDAEVAPLCDVTSLGFATYVVARAGKWRLVEKEVAASDLDNVGNKDDVVFVLARGLMTTDASGNFRGQDKTSTADVEVVARTLEPYEDDGPVGRRVAAFIDELKALQKSGATREETASFTTEGVKKVLCTSVASPYSPEYFRRDRLRIGAWGNFRAQDFDDAYMKTYADCGFDFILPFVPVSTSKLLALCDKYGIEATVNDGSYLEPIDGMREFCDHPSFTGCYVTDEPGSDAYDSLAAACNAYTKATGKRAYVNLLPMYANAAQLKYGAGAAAIEYYDPDPNLFRKYCAAFCEKFDSDYICTDIYPLNWNGDKKETYADYAESINIIASVAREYNRDFWCYIQTFAWTEGKRTPNEAEFRWQCYSMLSFGCKTILCWTYAGYRPEFPSLVDVESQKTEAWYDARAVFQELRRLSDVYVQYRNVGAFSHNCTDETPYLKFSDEYEDFAAIQEIVCPDPLLVGCFEAKDGSNGKAFTLVNMTELQDAVGTTVRMKLDASEAIAWYRGVPTTVQPNNEGFYDFYLATGEGVFVTLK